MKLWFKYAVGAVVGIIIGLILPPDNELIRTSLNFLSTAAIKIGQYAILPLLLFSIPVAAYQLSEDKEFWQVIKRVLLFAIPTLFIASLLGMFIVLLVNHGPIRLIADAAPINRVATLSSLIYAIFPGNILASLTEPTSFILPTFIFAICVGLSLVHERSAARHLLPFLDSLSRVFYHINVVFTEFFGFLLIFIAGAFVFTMRTVSVATYGSLIIILVIELVLMVVILIPALLYLCYRRRIALREFYALLAPAIAAVTTGDAIFALTSLMRHSKESLGIRRRSNLIVLPLTLMLGRVGTTMLTASSFIIILYSYSNIGISITSLLWILVMAPLASILISTIPGQGVLAALVSLSALYGVGRENGYLVIIPLALPLIAAGTLIDILFAGAVNLIIAQRHAHINQEKTVANYI